MSEERPIIHIAAAINAVGNAQLAVEADVDPVLGFRQWGGKDGAGNVTTWLARNKPGQLYSLQLTGPGFTGSGDGFLRNNATGVISAAPIAANDVPDHDNLNGIDSGTIFHVSNIERDEFHTPVTVVADSGLTLSGQNIGLSIGAGLQVISNVLQTDPSSVSHSSLDSLGSDDHLQYIRTDAVRGFSAAVTGQSATLGNHLTTRDNVLQMIEENSAGFEGSVLSIITVLPGSPQIGDRYLDNTGAPVSESGSLIEWTAGAPDAWVATWNPSDPASIGTKVYVIDENTDYRYTGVGPTAGWESIAAITAHNQLSGLGNDDHTQYSLVDGTRAFTGPVGGVTAGGTATNVAILQDVLDNMFTPENKNWGQVGTGTFTGPTAALTIFGFEGDEGVFFEGVWFSNSNGVALVDLNFSFEDGSYTGSMTVAVSLTAGESNVTILRDNISHKFNIAGVALEWTRRVYTRTGGGFQWVYQWALSGLINGTTTTVVSKVSQIGMDYDNLKLFGGTVSTLMDTQVLDIKRKSVWEKNILLAPEIGTFSNGFGDTPFPAYLMSGSRGGEGFPSEWVQEIWVDKIEAGIQSSAPIESGVDTTMSLTIHRNQSRSLVTPVMENTLVAETDMGTFLEKLTVNSSFAKLEFDDSIWFTFGGSAPATNIDLLMVKMTGWYIN